MHPIDFPRRRARSHNVPAAIANMEKFIRFSGSQPTSGARCRVKLKNYTIDFTVPQTTTRGEFAVDEGRGRRCQLPHIPAGSARRTRSRVVPSIAQRAALTRTTSQSRPKQLRVYGAGIVYCERDCSPIPTFRIAFQPSPLTPRVTAQLPERPQRAPFLLLTVSTSRQATGERKVLIFDLGGGGFDVSLLTFDEIFKIPYPHGPFGISVYVSRSHRPTSTSGHLYTSRKEPRTKNTTRQPPNFLLVVVHLRRSVDLEQPRPSIGPYQLFQLAPRGLLSSANNAPAPAHGATQSIASITPSWKSSPSRGNHFSRLSPTPSSKDLNNDFFRKTLKSVKQVSKNVAMENEVIGDVGFVRWFHPYPKGSLPFPPPPKWLVVRESPPLPKPVSLPFSFLFVAVFSVFPDLPTSCRSRQDWYDSLSRSLRIKIERGSNARFNGHNLHKEFAAENETILLDVFGVRATAQRKSPPRSSER
ncbi:hypothetical protein M407DRAFT_26137 [Tulasnella calospora MUT 4182]|uniref:Uncharacterized protein n=1 Tax=Tulasnella calospora MUT 4182 TaxID=1051891 RepID=A0A0C3QER8_9AGAM|nr:hypothetical protein M407DRAFT_26137 [Tulasnella calospora MUT 4182]